MDKEQNLNNNIPNLEQQLNNANYPNIYNNNAMNYNPFQNMMLNPLNPFLIQN